MAQTNTENVTGERVDLQKMVTEACETDDPALMACAISQAPTPNAHPRWTEQETVEHGLQESSSSGAIQVLQYLLDRGADVRHVRAWVIMSSDLEPSIDFLEVLLAHGWDINQDYETRESLLYLVMKYRGLFMWCLDHGARLDVPDMPVDHTAGYPRTILGQAALHGDIELFDMLRSRGAPLDPRTLHIAVELAILASPKDGSDDRSPSFERRMNMVRHLVDVVSLDVNAFAGHPGDTNYTPLLYAANCPYKQINYREVVDFLLDHGADPGLSGVLEGVLPEYSAWDSPIAAAELIGNQRFLGYVKDWRARHGAGHGAGLT